MIPVDLPDMPVVLLSHRGPASFSGGPEGRTASRGGGGLVTALVGLAGRLDQAVWICAATSDEDRAVMREQDGSPAPLALQPTPHVVTDADSDQPTIAVRMVEVDPQAHDDFYTVIANPLLWFIQHSLYGLATEPDLTIRERRAFDDGYVVVNEVFAEAVIDQVKQFGRPTLVMLHDYHFYLVADRVRAACPDVVITHFTHIPWPDPGAWHVLSPEMREQIMAGMLGNDIVAFHTEGFARNFLMCCQELLDLSIDLEDMTVQIDGRHVHARWYPISVDVDSIVESMQAAEVQDNVRALTERFLGDERQLVLRVDRTDPSKNIARGFRAFDVMLNDHPELRGHVTFFAMLQPSRQDVPEYLGYIHDIGGTVAEINARHALPGWQPIELRLENDLPLAFAAYSVCDALMVNAVNDGMNLVAKEAVLVNTRNGVLLLSENTGAHQELGHYAVTLYPFDIQQQADALHRALTMPVEERRRRLTAAAEVVRHNDVGNWLQAQLRDIERLTDSSAG